MKYEEFERIYQEYYLKILTFIHKRVPDLYEAEELTGDVFLSFYRNMDSYDEEKGSIATWLYAITANRLKNYYRDKKTHYSLEILKQQTIPREKMPEEIVAKIMREETLRKSLEQLSDREREILLGRFYYQKSSTAVSYTHLRRCAGIYSVYQTVSDTLFQAVPGVFFTAVRNSVS